MIKGRLTVVAAFAVALSTASDANGSTGKTVVSMAGVGIASAGPSGSGAITHPPNSVSAAQSIDREILLAVASDIAKEPGKLLGVGPNEDSAKVRLPHRVQIDTALWCSKGPGKCTSFGAAETVAIYRAIGERMNATLSTEVSGPPASNLSSYRFSEVTVRGDSAEVRVYMG